MSKKITVGLVQISELKDTHHYFPYAVGLLQAHAQQYASNAQNLTFLPFVYSRILVSEAVEQLKYADIVGFSAYVWNIKRSLAIAKELKALNPNVLIIFGGPQVPQYSESFLREHPFVDLCCTGEGERVFTHILEAYESQTWQDIAGVSFLDNTGKFKLIPPAPRIQDLDNLPSPYLSGVFDSIMPLEEYWTGVWETNRGCPFSCSFCDWGAAIQSKVFRFDIQRVKDEIDWFSQHKVPHVFCADANFGILKRDVEIARYYAQSKATSSYPEGLQIQTAKNVTQRIFEIQQVMIDAALHSISAVSFQSLNAPTLKAIQRDNISIQTYQDLQQFCLDRHIYTYTDVIIGLPEETLDSFKQGISEVIHLGQHNKILFQNAAILPNAEMGQPEYLTRYGIQTVPIAFPGHAQKPDGIEETLEIVVGCHSMPRSDWVQAMTFAWMTNLLYYTNRMFQLIFMVIHHQLGLSYKTLIESFTDEKHLSHYPLLNALHQSLKAAAFLLQQGHTAKSSNPLLFSIDDATHLSPEITLQIRLAVEGKVSRVYEEAFGLLSQLIRQENKQISASLLQEAFWVNRVIFTQMIQNAYYAPPQAKQMRFPDTLDLQWNLPAFYRSVLTGTPKELSQGQSVYVPHQELLMGHWS